MTGPSLSARGIPDSHCHLDMDDFAPDRETVLARARAAGVDAFLCPADISQPQGLQTTLDLAARHTDVTASAGLHPHQAKLRSETFYDTIRRLAWEKKIAAVGEIGLDYHYGFSSPEEQRPVFREQVALASEIGLPLIVHSRLAGLDIREAVDSERFSGGGILHCFTESRDIALSMIDRGFLISFSGILTFPNASDLRDTAKALPLDRILVETDAPYLAPVPHRGKRNEPSFVLETARLLAVLRNLPFESLAEALTANFRRLFPTVVESPGLEC
ncbi:MAG: TatD family hydrolase [Candidatus Aminicenantes bacterium]|nr:TatD family hydrolase [Candidatus Aminicenantes bacterium]